ncbi:Gag-Pol polyprotein [Anthophora plagiata]
MIDRFSRWPEAVPLKNTLVDTVRNEFYNNWIARYGAPETITTDRGCKRIRTTAYHPAANGMIERWHRSLKNAIKCHEDKNWLEVLPTVLLGLRTSFKEDLGATAAEMLYGETLRLPGEFLGTSCQ